MSNEDNTYLLHSGEFYVNTKVINDIADKSQELLAKALITNDIGAMGAWLVLSEIQRALKLMEGVYREQASIDRATEALTEGN